MRLCLLVLAGALTASASFLCPRGCSSCSGASVLQYSCGGLLVSARDDGFVEVNCQESVLNCSSLPSLSVGGGRPLQRLEITQCSLPPGPPRSLACALAASGAARARELALRQAASPLAAGHVQGMDLESLFMSFMPGVQTTVPIEAIDALPSLRLVYLLSGEAIPLRPHMFARSPPLEYLEISMSGVASIPGDAFAGLTRLRLLSLWGNKIRNVSVDAFRGLSSLEELRLSRNPLGRLPPGVFSGCPLLRRLCLDLTGLEVVPTGLLAGLDHLQEIIFKNGDLKLEPRAFASLPSLASLSLPGCKLPSLPPDAFSNSSRLVNLTLSHNRLRALPERVFGGLRALERLDLRWNQLDALEGGTFTELTSLKELQLDGNRLQELPDRMFSGLPHLWLASFADNRLQSIDFSFLGATSLRRLSLARNNLTWTVADEDVSSPLYMMEQLEWLDLSHNNISYVFSDWRFVLRKLTKLDLSYNAFAALALSDVQFLGPVEGDSSIEVDFRHNRIRSIQPRASWTEPSPRLRLLVDANPFRCDCHLYDLLEELREGGRYDVGEAECAQPGPLRGKSLASLPLDELSCALPESPCACVVRPARARVECECERLELAPGVEDSGYTDMALRLNRSAADLRALPDYVSELNLTKLELETIPLVPSTVKLIDLTWNSIRSVPKELLESNVTLKLAHNPLACDCWSSDDIAFLQSRSRVIEDYANVTCDGGSRVGGVDAGALCGVYRASLAGVLLAGMLLLLASLGALGYYYRVELQVYLYSRRWCLPLLPAEAPDDDKEYDVFVSFAHADERFVRAALLPRLEAAGYALLVRHRDWQVGATIPAQLHRSVARSRRTLLVLSRRWLRCTWAAEELRALHAQAAGDRRARAVVLLLDLARDELDHDARALLALATLVRYGERMCWEKVAYALPRAGAAGAGGAPPKEKGGLRVELNDEGQLVNTGFVKDVV